MYAQLHNTVRAQRTRPLLACRDISANPLESFYSQLLTYFDAKSQKPKSIGDTAVQFYLLNHGIALLDGSVTPDEALNEKQAELYNLYHRRVGEIGVRMAYDIVFMLTAMTSTTHPDGYHLDDVEQNYGKDARELIAGLTGKTNNVSFWTPQYSQLKPVLQSAQKEAGNTTITNGLRAMGYILDVRQKELAYGPLWRDIARMACDFFEGRKSLETMIDTSFTFCHCNGSFFEKGKLFSPVGNDLFKALDVQRAGQIPQFVAENKNPLTKSSETQDIHQQFKALFPKEFTAPMKWSDVKEVTRNQLIFTNKYNQHWNANMGGGLGVQAHNHPPPPKIFTPIDEDGYLNLTKPFK